MRRLTCQQAARLLQAGELVAFPTETVYGLGAVLSDERAIDQLFRVKGRPADNPLIVHLACRSQVGLVARPTPLFEKLADAFLPGPLTLVLEKAPSLSPRATAHLDSVAVRLPAHPLAQELLQALAVPLVAPSANRSGLPSSTTASHVFDDFDGQIAGVVDGGESPLGIESTVLALYPKLMLLRMGSISLEALEQVVEQRIECFSTMYTPRAPGMKYRHYAPSTPASLFYSIAHLQHYLAHNQRSYTLLEELTAATLYARLRAADKEGVEEILILCDKETRADRALMERLLRAAVLVCSPEGGVHERGIPSPTYR